MGSDTLPKTHIGLGTEDLAAAVAFYTDLLGPPPAKTRPGYAKFLLDSPPLNLSLNERPGAGSHPGHFGIQVATTGDVDARREALAARYPVRVEEDVRCCFARQDKFWVSDPDGNRWEVFVFLEDVEENDPQYRRVPASEVDASCCG